METGDRIMADDIYADILAIRDALTKYVKMEDISC